MNLPWPIVPWRDAWARLDQRDSSRREEIERMFTVKRTIGSPSRPRAIGCSLYFKPPATGQTWPSPDEATTREVRVRCGRATWMDAYVEPLRRNLQGAAQRLVDHDVHLYLAADLEWLVDRFVGPRVVVHVMEHASVGSQPGMMWRFLAHDEPGVEESIVVDAEEDWLYAVNHHVARAWRRSPLAMFRVVHPGPPPCDLPFLSIYRPVSGSHFGLRTQTDFSMKQALCGYAAVAIERGDAPVMVDHPSLGSLRQFGTWFPWYGCDESFLQQTLFPFFAERGVLTYYGGETYREMLDADLAWCASVNPRSRLTRLVDGELIDERMPESRPARDARTVDHGCDYWRLYDWVAERIPANGKFVEVGCLLGAGLGYFAQRTKALGKPVHAFGVDLGVGPDSYRPAEPYHDTPRLLANLRDCRVDDRCTLVVGDSVKSASAFADESIWFVFIDACHTYEAVRDDLRAWWPKVAKGGWIAGHDYRFHNFPGVTRAVDEFFSTPTHGLSAPQAPTCFLKRKM